MRFYNVYGRGQNIGNIYQGMVSIYLAYLLKRTTVPVTGSLDRYRDFVHVDDVVDVLMRALTRLQPPFDVFNIGTGIKTTVRELLAKLVAAMELPPESSDRRMRGVSERRFRFGRRYSPCIGATRLEASRRAR